MTNPGNMHYNYLHTTMTMKRISTIGTHPRERGRHGNMQLGTPYAEPSETSLGVLCETCRQNREAQRRTGVNGVRAGYVFVSIRVVPPSDRSLFRER